METTEVKIEPNGYYKPSEVITLHPFFAKKGYMWLRDNWTTDPQEAEQNGMILVRNTSLPGRKPSYIFTGQALIDYLIKNNHKI